jgi:hypothetical protein
VRLVPGSNQNVLGPGTQDTDLVPAGRRGEISKAAGWISPVVIARGRVAGLWELVDDTVTVTAIAEAGRLSCGALRRETSRLGEHLGRRLRLALTR